MESAPYPNQGWSEPPPADLFGFDMMVHGVRGDRLPRSDWRGARGLWGWLGRTAWWTLLQSQRANNSDREGWSSWVGRVGPPENLNEVSRASSTAFSLTKTQFDSASRQMVAKASRCWYYHPMAHGLANARRCMVICSETLYSGVELVMDVALAWDSMNCQFVACSLDEKLMFTSYVRPLRNKNSNWLIMPKPCGRLWLGFGVCGMK